MKLTPKQEAFCNKYIESGNASEAYRYAYACQNMKQESIHTKASLLLRHPKIEQRVNELQEELKGVSDISKQRLLDELTAILESKITDYVHFDGQTVKFKAFDTLTESQIKAIENIKESRNGIELKLHGKSWAIDKLSKMLGYNAPTKQELTGKNGDALFSTVNVKIIRSKNDLSDEGI